MNSWDGIIRRGDVFCVRTGGIGQAIRFVTRIWSKDGRAKHNHTGIIVDPAGFTLEAKATINRFNLSAYRAREIIIARPKTSPGLIAYAIDRVTARHGGQMYPYWRLPLHLIPWLARKVSYKGRYVVCSELNAEYLRLCGVRGRGFTGVNPDMLADEMKTGNYEIIYNGRL